MPRTNNNSHQEPPRKPAKETAKTTTKEWTLMFYFASDNPLGPTIISQLKALKQAGHHRDANVIAYYDPPVPGMPTHYFDVNITEKIKAGGEPMIGSLPHDSWVRNLVKDKLWGKQKTIEGKKIEDLIGAHLFHPELYQPPDPGEMKKAEEPKGSAESLASTNGNAPAHKDDDDEPETSLGKFLQFCADKYPARNYMLFILGHGLVVGNDVFLYDESSATHSLSLAKLREVLRKFKTSIKKASSKAQFQLISFHSCSMSSLEVAYELKDTANYMLAAQCPTYIGNWPYRQILIRVLNDLERGQNNVAGTLSDIFHYCLYNSYDYQLAGYCFDLCLCDLRNIKGVKEALGKLSGSLITGLSKPRAKDLILLAHWDAQSYWGEMYTDLYDFCFRLKNRCLDVLKQEKPSEKVSATLKGIQKACEKMIEVLEPQSKKSPNQLIVHADFVGAAYQYAHGLSVYFPWSEPFGSPFWSDQYGKYKLIAKGKDEKSSKSWKDFLDSYFDKTRRDTRHKETGNGHASLGNDDKQMLEAITNTVFARRERGHIVTSEVLGPDDKVGGADGTGSVNGKVGGADGTGDDYYYSIIKNYPLYTRAPEPKRAGAKRKAVVTQRR